MLLDGFSSKHSTIFFSCSHWPRSCSTEVSSKNGMALVVVTPLTEVRLLPGASLQLMFGSSVGHMVLSCGHKVQIVSCGIRGEGYK